MAIMQNCHRCRRHISSAKRRCDAYLTSSAGRDGQSKSAYAVVFVIDASARAQRRPSDASQSAVTVMAKSPLSSSGSSSSPPSSWSKPAIDGCTG